IDIPVQRLDLSTQAAEGPRVASARDKTAAPTPRNDVSSCHSYPAINPCVRFNAVRKAPANEATPTIRRVRWEPLPTRRQPRGGRFGTSPVRRFGSRCALPPRADRLTSRARLHVAEETPEELRSLRVGASTAGDAHPLTRRPRF